jgi:hypothetical protein
MTPEDLRQIDFPPLTEIRLLAAKGGGVLVCLDYPPDLDAVSDGRRTTFVLRWSHAQLLEARDLFLQAIEAFRDVQDAEDMLH